MKIKKIITFLASTAIALSSINAFANDNLFDDVKTTDWFYNDVMNIVDLGIMNGIEKNTFSPNSNISRAMFMTVLWRMEDQPQANLLMPFSDVPEDAYYAEAVRWAAASKIASGTTETTFSPDDIITREQMATIIYRYMQYKNIDLSSADDTNTLSYNDIFDVSDYAKTPMHYCLALNIITGDTNENIMPKNSATRAQAATILMRINNLFNTNKADDIVILYTGDVHCSIDNKLNYASLAAYKSEMQKNTDFVTLIDLGDAIQGDSIGVLSTGEYAIDIMNQTGYDYAVLGNHEFDYGIDRTAYLIDKSNAKYLCSNISYVGSNDNLLKNVKPYAINEYGNIKVAYIGVTTPYSIIMSTPTFFMEDGKLAYSFNNEDSKIFYDTIQQNIDKCKQEGADYVVLLTHCGDTDDYKPYSSIEIIENTTGADVVIDSHSHSVIDSKILKNKTNDDVILTAAGTNFDMFGKLVISSDKITTELISEYESKDAHTLECINAIKSKLEDQLNKVIATNSLALQITDDAGVSIVKNRETSVGDLCADAYRKVMGADIGLINGGNIRAGIPQGDVTFADIFKIHPFGNTSCLIKATGAQITDALEWSMKDVSKEYKKDGVAVGENGGFYQVSGLKFTVDTSVKSSTTTDEKGFLKSIDGKRRVSDIKVLNQDGKYEAIDPDKLYSIASTDYNLLYNGDGQTAFDGAERLSGGGPEDFYVVVEYINEYLNGDLSTYSKADDRITIK